MTQPDTKPRMKLVILGSGTCVPSQKRSAPAYFLEAEDRQILIDCGSGTLLRLEKAGRSYRDIDAVFITHTHPDHVSDLMPLVHALLATPQFKRGKDLTLAGPEGFGEFYRKCVAVNLGRAETFSINIIEIGDEYDYTPFRIVTAKTVHSGNSIAFRFEHRGKSVVFTGDADYDTGVVKLAGGADVLVADCSFPDAMKSPGHMTPRECGLVARHAGVKKLFLSHIYSTPVPDAERVKECQAVFDGKIVLAEDLLESEL